MNEPTIQEPKGPLQTEPVRVAGITTNFLIALFMVLAAFQLKVSDDQQKAIIGAVIPTITFVQFMFEFARSYVTPVAKAEQKIDEAFKSSPRAGDTKPTL